MIDLHLRALIAPDKCGADDGVVLIEKSQAVHLAGEANARNLIAVQSGFLQNAADGGLCGVPPVFRTLLGPQRTVHENVFVRGGEAVGHLAVGIDEKCARAAGADVDAEPEHKRRC